MGDETLVTVTAKRISVIEKSIIFDLSNSSRREIMPDFGEKTGRKDVLVPRQ